jgi:hypothetical protein
VTSYTESANAVATMAASRLMPSFWRVVNRRPHAPSNVDTQTVSRVDHPLRFSVPHPGNAEDYSTGRSRSETEAQRIRTVRRLAYFTVKLRGSSGPDNPAA